MANLNSILSIIYDKTRGDIEMRLLQKKINQKNRISQQENCVQQTNKVHFNKLISSFFILQQNKQMPC